MIASFGGITFDATIRNMTPIGGFKREFGLDTETQDQNKAKPATLVKGPKLEGISLDVHLVRAFGKAPESLIKSLEALVESGEPHKFVLGGKTVGKYRWLLTAVTVSATVLGGNGEMIDATVSLTLQEFVKEGTPTSKSGTAGAATPGLVSFGVNDAYKIGAADSETKSRQKRTVKEDRLSKL